ISRSFKEFYVDIYKMIGLFQKKGLKPKDKVGLFVMPYSYDFYVVMFASFIFQLNIIVFDSYRKKHIQELMNLEEVSYCFVDKKTKWISHFILPRCKRVDITPFARYQPQYDSNIATISNTIILTTFTSGSTGTPKAIHRTLEFLLGQAEEIQNEMDLNPITSIFGGLPIYNILSLYLLKTTCISKHIKDIYKLQPDCVLTNIQKILLEKRSYPMIQNVMLGGAILYSWEVSKIRNVFPNAKIAYVYGASEGAIIYKTNLDFYQENLFSFERPANEINVSISSPNKEGIGEIVIEGDRVNTENHIHYTGDLGKMNDGTLILFGRRKYSSLDQGFYNYAFDEQIRKENHCVAFSFFYKNEIYVFHNKKLKNKREGVKYIFMRKLPMDLKHKTKLSYQECIDRIEKRMK
ncbi:MAG: AMP-binding protein, partial [Anaeroplasmataceae bacterium]|nr:AMP-binding protein [Anaeroplasmataceae bacterium]